ncbi:MAG TPA: DUF4383 domain-containing protein [Solirubrobacteraceae bacterium]
MSTRTPLQTAAGLVGLAFLHNLVHVLFGIAGLSLARRTDGARAFLLVGGATYLALWIYGLVIEKTGDANFVPVNSADDWLHFALGALMVVLGYALGRARTRPTAASGPGSVSPVR